MERRYGGKDAENAFQGIWKHTLITVADQTPYTINRVLKESVGGELDFKLQLDRSKLYYDSSNKVVYNRNEAGNYVWAYYLTLHDNWNLQGILAQGGSIVQGRLDEPWDYNARWAGVKAAFERMGLKWLYFIKFDLLHDPQL